MSEFIRHEACPACGSSDGNAVYEDHSYCFVCGSWVGTGEELSTRHNHQMVRLEGSAVPLKKRGLSQKVCEQYKIYRDGDHLKFHYFNSDGQLIGYKSKSTDKEFRYVGDTDGRFFGQHLFPVSGKRVVITEGEIDAASCQEAMPGWPMVSLPSGAQAAKKSI